LTTELCENNYINLIIKLGGDDMLILTFSLIITVVLILVLEVLDKIKGKKFKGRSLLLALINLITIMNIGTIGIGMGAVDFTNIQMKTESFIPLIILFFIIIFRYADA